MDEILEPTKRSVNGAENFDRRTLRRTTEFELQELGELKHLRTLVLYENQLSGRIPKELAQSEAPGA